MCRSLLVNGSRYPFYLESKPNFLNLLKLIFHHGCDLNGFRDSTIEENSAAISLRPYDSRDNVISFQFLNGKYADKQLAADIAHLFYDAGALLNPAELTGGIDYEGGCHQPRSIAESLQFRGRIVHYYQDRNGDADRIAWLLQAASKPRSLQDCAICAVRRALEFDIPYKLEQLKDQLPPSLIAAIRKDSCFDSGMPVSL